jgi:eukaryotic-like serine/threonine-protein kinase
MTDRWRRVKEVYQGALVRDPESRTAYLRDACGNDEDVLREVNELLQYDSQAKAEAFLERPGDDSRTIGSQSVGFGDLPTSGVAAEGEARIGVPLAVFRPNATESLEIPALLRYRLRVLSLITVIGFGFFDALRFVRLDLTPAVIWVMLPGIVYLAAAAALAAVLWRRRIYSLSQLRSIEGLLFGITALYLVIDTYIALFVPPAWLPLYVMRHVSEISILVRQPSIIWMVLIIGYGTFIPNTGRRCAVVTSLMALCPLVTIALAGTFHAIPQRPLFLFLSEMLLWMGTAVAMAIYGSHKITVLREEALAARKLGQYRLKRRLGQGGMGEVYLAEHILLRRPCAVKVIRPAQAGDPEILHRFLREVQVTATLTHPNTIQVFDYGQASDGTVFYAMEYLTGLNLEQLVRRHGPIPARRAIFVLRQLCGALAEAHAIGLIHRDIKPSNVILCQRGGLHDVVKLLDFGLVRIQSTDAPGQSLTQPGLIFGTPTYMSPEQASGQKHVDGRADIYSLGALAYFLVIGRPPFVRDSLVETLTAHIKEPVTPFGMYRTDLPEDFESVVLRCLAKHPGERFANVSDLEQALRACTQSLWTESEAEMWWNNVETAPSQT